MYIGSIGRLFRSNSAAVENPARVGIGDRPGERARDTARDGDRGRNRGG